jgi:hypothetical protein
MNKIIFIILLLLTKNIINQPFGGDESLPTIREICKIAKINYKNVQKANSVQEFLDKIDYNLEEEKNYTRESYLDKIFTEDDLTKVSNPSEKYLFKITEKYIFNKGVLILSLFWIGLIISLILGKCFFSEKTSEGTLFAQKYINWGQIVFIIIFLLSSIPLFSSINFKKSFNGASCALVRFLQEIKFGNSTYNEGRIFFKPYTWLGLLNIDNILLDIQNFFNKTGQNRKEVFDDIYEIKNNISNLGEQIQNLEKFFKNSSILFYNRKMKPLYISQFDNIDKDGTKIHKIYEEYQFPLERNFKYMLNINDTTTTFEHRNHGYKKNMEEMYNKTNGFSKLITQKSINITHNIQFLHEKTFNNIYKYFKYSYILNILISILLSIFMFIYYHKRIYCFKIIMHFGWNICMIIIILSFVVSYFLLSLGASFAHLIYIIHENVLKVRENGFFETCLNKNGNLLDLIGIEQKRIFTELNDFYHLIIRQNKIIQKIEKSNIISEYLDEINKLKANIALTTNDEYKFIDINHLLKRLSEITGDYWVSERISCNKYRYLGKDIMLDLNRDNINVETDYCLTIKDNYKEDELKIIYKNKDENTLYEIITIINNLNSYFQQNEEILTELETFLIQIENAHKKIIKKVNKKSNSIHNLVDLYLSLFPDMNEEESISDFFNCGILKDELIIYYDFNYNYIYFYCKLFGIISLTIGLLTFIGMFLIINSIQWIDYEEFNKPYINEDERERELDEIVEETDEEYDEDEDKNT